MNETLGLAVFAITVFALGAELGLLGREKWAERLLWFSFGLGCAYAYLMITRNLWE